MRKIAITGGIGSGKTTVTNIFIDKGFEVIDADKVARDVVAPGRYELEEIKNIFGSEILSGNVLNRKKLAELIFSDPQKRKKLDSIMQPAIAQTMAIRTDYFLNSGEVNDLIFDIPLFFERNLNENNEFDLVIVVNASNDKRIERITSRDEVNVSQANERIDAQMLMEEKVKLADVVVDNDGSLSELKNQIENIINLNNLKP